MDIRPLSTISPPRIVAARLGSIDVGTQTVGSGYVVNVGAYRFAAAVPPSARCQACFAESCEALIYTTDAAIPTVNSYRLRRRDASATHRSSRAAASVNRQNPPGPAPNLSVMRSSVRRRNNLLQDQLRFPLAPQRRRLSISGITLHAQQRFRKHSGFASQSRGGVCGGMYILLYRPFHFDEQARSNESAVGREPLHP